MLNDVKVVLRDKRTTIAKTFSGGLQQFVEQLQYRKH